jgi:predicted CXXCH cytochrome family protein
MIRSLKTGLLILLLLPVLVWAQTIVSTKHNMSVSGPGAIKATTESEICVFCHAPHNARPDHPLWNRTNPGLTYTLYASSTTQATIGQPDGASILCLSCHDGTIALGSVISRTVPITMAGGVTTMPSGVSNLTKDISNDHPLSFIYDAALAAADGQLLNPATLTGPVKLENGKLQCTSCHDPHKNLYTKFLVASTQSSGLCLACHTPANWIAGSHRNSTSTWNGVAPNPWFHTPYTTVAQNGCENCHNPHSAGGKLRLMDFQPEENNCLDCHNGNVAVRNIQAQEAKTYRHNVYGYTGIHDPVENSLVSTNHVECTDCHNAHQSNNTTAVAPNVNGTTIGVKGIDQSGNAINHALYQYQICYRCHSSTPGQAPPSAPRVIVQTNVRLQFATSNPSFHPVVGPRNNTEITGNLIAPNTASTILYCTACHASDGAGSPAGPHGSIYPHILKAQYLTANNTTESAAAYALCYSCHVRNNIINDINTFSEHRKHIVEERAPCTTCHDPHGIGNPGTLTNNSNLINFNTSLVTPSGGVIQFTDTGLRHGSCRLVCHGENHNPYTY